MPRVKTNLIGKPHLVVVGAGAFGGWTALELLRRGARVTLLDAWGPGHLRSSSGGETRVTRCAYGPDRLYVDRTIRSLARWERSERELGRKLLHPTGALWMFSGADDYVRSSLPFLAEFEIPIEELSVTDAARRYPQIRWDGVTSVFYEPRAGCLLARLACQAVAARFVAEGGVYSQAAVKPPKIQYGHLGGLESISLSDGSTLSADGYVFACGPWLGELFPEVLGETIQPTRQEVLYFGTAAGDARFEEGNLPIWFDFGERLMYGIPGNLHRGFKVADDRRGAPISPTTAERGNTAEALAIARSTLARRFPDLADAPLLGAEVCQYENSPDGHLIVDRHPEAENVWLAGGGSGHGFKLAPVLGEELARLILDGGEPPELFRLARLEQLAERTTQFPATVAPVSR